MRRYLLILLIWRLEHDQKLLKCLKKPSGVYKMQENSWRPELCPGLRWGSLQRSHSPPSWREWLAAPSHESHPNSNNNKKKKN